MEREFLNLQNTNISASLNKVLNTEKVESFGDLGKLIQANLCKIKLQAKDNLQQAKKSFIKENSKMEKQKVKEWWLRIIDYYGLNVKTDKYKI